MATYYQKLLEELQKRGTAPEGYEPPQIPQPGYRSASIPTPEDYAPPMSQEDYLSSRASVASDVADADRMLADSQPKPDSTIDTKPSKPQQTGATPTNYRADRGLGLNTVAQAFAPVADYLAGRGNTAGQLAQQGEYIRTERQYDDPASPISKRAQAILGQVPMFQGKDLSKISYNAASKLFPQMASEAGSGFDTDNTQNLFNKYRNEPIIKNAESAISSYQTINALAENPEAAGPNDLALVYSFMKSLDPQSTVRESEFQTASEALGLVNKMKGLMVKYENGSLFKDANARREFANTARMVAKHVQSAAKMMTQKYRKTAPVLGANPDAFNEFQFEEVLDNGKIVKKTIDESSHGGNW
jgi:hypothetical protein